MVKVRRSFSQPFIPRKAAIHNSCDSGASFLFEDPAIRESAENMRFVTKGGTTSDALDVTTLLTAVGGEQMHYIEFNSVRREPETRQRWPLMHIVSDLLDQQPERSADVAKPVLLHKDGVAL